MKKRMTFHIFSTRKIVSVLFIVFSSIILKAQTSDEVIKNYLNAVGGADKFKKIQTVKAIGNFQQGGMNFPFTVYQKRPNSQLIEATYQGMTQKIAYDGSTGWVINPFQGRSNAEKMDSDQVKQYKFQADIDGPFIDYASKGYVIEYAGTEDIDGSPTHHLKLTSKEGDIRDYYFDKEAALLVKEKDHIKRQDGSTQESETNYSDYKEVDGILIPFTIENVSEYQGQKFSSFIKTDSIEHNVAVEDAIFKMPDSKPTNK